MNQAGGGDGAGRGHGTDRADERAGAGRGHRRGAFRINANTAAGRGDRTGLGTEHGTGPSWGKRAHVPRWPSPADGPLAPWMDPACALWSKAMAWERVWRGHGLGERI